MKGYNENCNNTLEVDKTSRNTFALNNELQNFQKKTTLKKKIKEEKGTYYVPVILFQNLL